MFEGVDDSDGDIILTGAEFTHRVRVSSYNNEHDAVEGGACTVPV